MAYFSAQRMVSSLGVESAAPSIKCSINQFAIYFTACNFSAHHRTAIEKTTAQNGCRTKLFI